MATNPIFRYPLDPTGTDPDNKVIGEEHTLPNRPIRALAPNYGLFFTESVVLIDLNTQQPLTSSQFRCVEMQELPTARYAKEICSVILIEDTAVSNNVALTYQALGGEYSYNSQALVDMVNHMDTENRPVNWPNILNKPAGYNPAPHYHDSGDIYGFEYVVHALDRLRQAVFIGDEAAHDELRRYIDDAIGGSNGDLAGLANQLQQHEQNNNNPHATTKAQVGLTNVDNFATASVIDAQAGTATNLFMTPASVKAAIEQFAPALNHTHSFVDLQNKPTTLQGYGVTAVDVSGLITTANSVRVTSGGGASTIMNASSMTFNGTNAVPQGAISCSTSTATVHNGTLTYTAANHSFVGAIGSSGDVTYYASDKRLKKNIRRIENASDKVEAIGGFIYDWDLELCSDLGFTPSASTEHGLIAQEVQKVLPEAVVPTAFNDEYLTVKYHRLVPLLVAALSEHAETIRLLRQDIQSLQG